jgi:hypothetical protein
LVIMLLVACPHLAHAYIGPPIFSQSAWQGGGGGMYFTGAPRGKAYDCAICHVDGAKQIEAKVMIAADDGSPFFPGVYTPGKSYAITIAMGGEHLGFGAARNVNTFLAEVDDDQDAPIAGFGGFDASLTTIDGDNVIAASGQEAQTSWSFHFIAPPAGRGAITLYASMVDGNGGDGTSMFPSDPLGDDVASVTVRLCEGSAGCAPRASRQTFSSPAASGCTIAATGRTRVGSARWLMVAAAIAILATRRRWLLAFLLIAGCHDPIVPAECPNRVCGDAQLGVPTVDAPPMMDCNGESWQCGPWTSSPAGSNNGVRTCVDKNMRGTMNCEPATTAMLPALDFDQYKCAVEPILDRGCAMMGCHGTVTGHSFRMFARGRLRNDQTVPQVPTCLNPGAPVNLNMQGSGTIMCVGWSPHTAEEWQMNFDSARSFMIGVSTPDASELIAEPMAQTYYTHTGVKLWATPMDPDYVTIRDWLGGATLGGTCDPGAN